MGEVLRFYSVNEEFGEFSNFAYYAIKIDGILWQIVEHYFQAQKFTDKAYQKKIKNANTSMQAAILGRDRKQKLRKDWESAKVSIMRQAVYAKFTQHIELSNLLLFTEDRKLIEHTENDNYGGSWG